MGKCIDHFPTGLWRFDYQLVHTCRVFPSIDLCYSSYTDEPVRVALEHEFLERAHPLQVALLCCPKDPLSQITNCPIGFFPMNGLPIGLFLGSVC